MDRKTTTVLAVAAAALAAAGGADAESWLPFFVIPSGVILIDHDSIVRRPGQVSARLESTFPRPQRISRNGRVFDYIKTIDQVEVDCKAEVYKNVSRDLYSSDGQEAVSINEADNPMVIQPHTAQAALVTAYCQ
jgi:hypothetical protein